MTQALYGLPGDVAAPQEGTQTRKHNKPYVMIPDEDMAWALSQRPTVFKLWAECWRCDPYGSRFVPLTTNLKPENFRKAKRELRDFFTFEWRMTVVAGKPQFTWLVKNQHGARSPYWKTPQPTDETLSPDSQPEPTSLLQSFEPVEPFPANLSTTPTAATAQTDISPYSLPRLPQQETKGDRVPTSGTAVPDPGTVVPTPGTAVPTSGTVNPTLSSLNSLTAQVSERLNKSSVSLQKHFQNSLNDRDRHKFLEFCQQKITQIESQGTPIHTPAGWIAKHYEQYWQEFSQNRSNAVDFERHPLWSEALTAMRLAKYRFIALGIPNCEAIPFKTRKAMANYATEQNLLLGTEL